MIDAVLLALAFGRAPRARKRGHFSFAPRSAEQMRTAWIGLQRTMLTDIVLRSFISLLVGPPFWQSQRFAGSGS